MQTPSSSFIKNESGFLRVEISSSSLHSSIVSYLTQSLFINTKSLSHCCYSVPKSCLTLVIPWTVALQAPLPMGFPRQKYWSGLRFPSPGDLPKLSIYPVLLTGRRTLTTEILGMPTGKVQSLSRVQLFGTPRTADARLPCPSLSLRICSNSCSLSQWCHPPTSSSVVPISSCSQSFLALESFPMSQLFSSGDQSIGASASTLFHPMNIYCWFSLGLTDLMSLSTTELSSVFSSTAIWKHLFWGALPSLWFNSHMPTWLLLKTITLTIWNFFFNDSLFTIFSLHQERCLLGPKKHTYLLIFFIKSISHSYSC